MELNEIGKIVSTHGLKGEVKVKTDSSFINERFKKGNILYIKENKNNKELKVVSHRSMAGYELVCFEGYNDCDQAMVLRGKSLYAIKDRNLLKENELFYSDYIGLNVSYFNKVVGKVIEIVNFPQGDYLSIKTNDDNNKYVPLNKMFIERVDLKERVVFIVEMEGLL